MNEQQYNDDIQEVHMRGLKRIITSHTIHEGDDMNDYYGSMAYLIEFRCDMSDKFRKAFEEEIYRILADINSYKDYDVRDLAMYNEEDVENARRKKERREEHYQYLFVPETKPDQKTE